MRVARPKRLRFYPIANVSLTGPVSVRCSTTSGRHRRCDHIRQVGGNLRDVLDLIYGLTECGIGLRTLADPMPIDTSNGDNPMARMAMLMVALFAEVERVHANERAAYAREVRPSKASRRPATCPQWQGQRRRLR